MKINIPGLHNSDVGHWQSWLEEQYPADFYRVEQNNWDAPNCEEWINQMEQTLADKIHKELILIGHSIGCMAIVNWFERFKHPIKGALLVAPSDCEREAYPDYITGFAPIPKTPLPFPSIVVGSTNDHVTDIKRTKVFAKHWGSKLVMLDNAGHIETKSGFGKWPLAVELVSELELKT